MDSVKSNLYPCAHCSGKGTCHNGSDGSDGSTCNACIKRNELKGKGHVGLLCGACGGLGMAEPYTERLNKRTKPLLAMGVVFIMLIIISVLAFLKNPHFTEILAFATTLISGIVTYYFSGHKSVSQ